MKPNPPSNGILQRDCSELPDGEVIERVEHDFGLSRRSFAQTLGAGLLIAVAVPAVGQQRGQRGEGRGRGGGQTLSARIHLGKDGTITVLAGKVEGGQGARGELSQAAAEELGVSASQILMVLADTLVVPDDGITAGSRTTPGTVPPVRQAAAAVRNLLLEFACRQWKVERAAVEMRDGQVVDVAGKLSLTYADFAKSDDATKLLEGAIPPEVELMPVKEWKVLGKPMLRPNARDIVIGAHKYPSDIARPGMLYGKCLRAPAYGAKLVSVDLAPAKAMEGVVVVQDDQFVGVAARNSTLATKALKAVSDAAKWEIVPHPGSKELFAYLKQNAQGGVPPNPYADQTDQPKALRRTYEVAYVQHAPLEPRAAVAEWNDGKLTVWTGSQNPFGCRGELARAFHLPEDQVRVVIPDFGAGFGGKHTGECGVEAARLARAAGKPVSLQWTRAEEFTWAYFRPAAVIEAESSLDAQGRIATWHFININSGANAVDTPYAISKKNCRHIPSRPPLRHGSYRGLAAAANNFAREVFMDELAAAAGADPLAFRLAHLENARLRAVLEKAAKEFNWSERVKKKDDQASVGLACGTEKGSVVAACVEIEIDRKQKTIQVRRVCEAFECGKILNPANLLSQVQGCILMGLGAALREEMQFEEGRILNATFRKYLVPRFADVPELDIHLLDRPDLPSAGGGETPIIAIAPAIANAVFRATGASVRAMPVRLAGA